MVRCFTVLQVRKEQGESIGVQKLKQSLCGRLPRCAPLPADELHLQVGNTIASAQGSRSMMRDR